MIITKNISKNFGSFQALSDVSFEINKGEIVGFLGRNGAGKTTLMRILTSFLPASSGTVIIDGDDVSKDSLITRQKIGYLPETPPLYLNMTVKDYLKFAAEIKGIPAKNRRRQFDSVMAECQLEHVASKTIATLSKGYKQRVGIAQAIIHDPKLLILDEPTSGLDPIQNLQVRNLIKNLKDQRTVIISTHILSEIEHIAQRVLMIKSGKIIIDESLGSLISSHNPCELNDKNSHESSDKGSSESRAMNLEDIFILYHSEQKSDQDNNKNSALVNHHE
ncbi:MAG: ABC-2 type transport system ATP-binding protein [Oleiphilaceae bacterium]|jgi:ABC-2 type transport system ATP-binding protein